VPVFIVTHHARPPIEMEGGTTFHFVTGGIRDALERARAAAGGKAEFVQADLTDAASARELAGRAVSFTGSIDILVNNAGIYPFQSTVETAEELFDAVHNLNVKVPFFLTAELAPAMLERGHGSIINLSTIAARKGLPGAAAYGSSKAALDQLTRTWASEYGPSGVRVNAVVPGIIETEGVQAGLGEDRSAFVAITPWVASAAPRRSRTPWHSSPLTKRPSSTARC